jgi:hypothetical protein
VTAGHCETTMSGSAQLIEVDSPTPPDSSAGNLGPALGSAVRGQYGGGMDYGVITSSGAGYAPQPAVAGWGGGGTTTPTTEGEPESNSVPITGEVAALKGDQFCKSGSTTGWTCGTVSDVDTSVSVSGQAVNSIVSDTCLLPGDSGGAALMGTIAIGIDSGGSFGTDCDTPGAESVFFPMVSGLTSDSVSGQLGSSWQLAVPVSSTAHIDDDRNRERSDHGQYGTAVPRWIDHSIRKGECFKRVVEYPADEYCEWRPHLCPVRGTRLVPGNCGDGHLHYGDAAADPQPH